MKIKVKNLGLTHYEDVWLGMRNFVAGNPEQSEIWITEHHPIYTIGLNKKGLTLPKKSTINHIYVDRGGKITYHGPGQIIIYPLINLKNYKITIKEFVSLLEGSIMQFLEKLGIASHKKKDAPGVYIGDSKIASIGLRLKNHFTYHGLSLNMKMDLSPFNAIDPCGFKNLAMTQLSFFNNDYTQEQCAKSIIEFFQHNLEKYYEQS